MCAQSKAVSQRLRPRAGHPTGECHSGRNLHSGVSATGLPGGPSAVCDIDIPRPLTKAADFCRRTTACWNSYFKAYRRATLLGFSPKLPEDFLSSLWNDIQNPIGSLLEFNLLFDPIDYYLPLVLMMIPPAHAPSPAPLPPHHSPPTRTPRRLNSASEQLRDRSPSASVTVSLISPHVGTLVSFV